MAMTKKPNGTRGWKRMKLTEKLMVKPIQELPVLPEELRRLTEVQKQVPRVIKPDK